LLTKSQSSSQVPFALGVIVINILTLDHLLFAGSHLGCISLVGIHFVSMHLVEGAIGDQKLWTGCDHSQIVVFFAFASDGLCVTVGLALPLFGRSLRR
jgi:hypothetical protein